MELAPYLNFNGQCAAAFKLYEQVLGGRIVEMHKHGDTPAKDFVPPEWHDKIMHVRMVVGSFALMGSDSPPAHYAAPQGTFVSITVPSASEGERIFRAFADGGTVTMPFEKTFWSPGFGMVVDRFGTPWMVNTAQEVALA
jgi:PhnB protein